MPLNKTNHTFMFSCVFKVTPIISDKIMEHLEYKINKLSETEGTISLAWEKVIINIPFKLNQ